MSPYLLALIAPHDLVKAQAHQQIPVPLHTAWRELSKRSFCHIHSMYTMLHALTHLLALQAAPENLMKAQVHQQILVPLHTAWTQVCYI